MYKHCINMEQKQTIVSKWGNSAGVSVPLAWLGQEVKVLLLDRSTEIKKEVFDLLKENLEDIMGVYLVGSYARGEQSEDSDIDILAISKTLKKEIISGKYHISVYPLESVKKTLKKDPIMIYPRLVEAKPLFNSSLIESLNLAYGSMDFSKFFQGTKRIIKIDSEILELDKLDGSILKSVDIIYSIVLRLRGMFILKCLVKGENYSKKLFKRWLSLEIKDFDSEGIYSIYEMIKNNKQVKEDLKIEVAEKLLNLLKKEVKNRG
jgi:predicted nucleotidyltransferase/putative transposon-encoded protein